MLEEEKAGSQRLQEQLNQLNTKAKNLRRDKEDMEGEVRCIIIFMLHKV